MATTMPNVKILTVRTYALTMCGSTPMPMWLIAMTYGDAPAVLPPPVTTFSNSGQYEAQTMPAASAPPMKNKPKRKYTVLKAVLIYTKSHKQKTSVTISLERS